MSSLSNNAVRVVQVTDPHIGETEAFSLAGVNTLQSFEAVMQALEACEYELLAVTGDIAAEGAWGAYRLFAEVMSKPRVTFAWLPGNHDRFDVMCEQIASQPFRESLDFANWRLLFLNSAVSGQVAGWLDDSQFALLHSAINSDDDKSIAIFIHHPPSPVGCDWLDKQRVSNSEQLADLLKGCKKVKAIFTGHVHQESQCYWHGIPVYTSPSTCVQFAENSAEFSLSNKGPGYRWIDFLDDGQLKTGVRYIVAEGQTVDQTCMGY